MKRYMALSIHTGFEFSRRVDNVVCFCSVSGYSLVGSENTIHDLLSMRKLLRFMFARGRSYTVMLSSIGPARCLRRVVGVRFRLLVDSSSSKGPMVQ